MSSSNSTDSKSTKKISFVTGLLIYAGVWVVITITVCCILYYKFAAYQDNYDLAQAAANPDLYIGNYLYLFDKDNILLLSDPLKQNISDLEKSENIDSYILGYVEDSSVSFNRCDNFVETKPLYNIYADDTLIGSVLLKQSADTDSFGFHGYELKDCSLLIDAPELNSYTISILDGDKLYVNGIEITDSVEHSSEIVSSFMDDKAAERSEITHTIDTYCINNLMKAPDVKIIRNDEEIVLSENSGMFCNTKLYDDDFLEEVQDRVLATGEAYVKNMNRYGTFAGVSAYLVYGGAAYNSISSAQQGISWAGAPDIFEINNSEITDMVQYGDDTFVVTTHYEFYRLYRGVEYNEEMTLKWLFIKSGDYWYALDFTLGN